MWRKKYVLFLIALLTPFILMSLTQVRGTLAEYQLINVTDADFAWGYCTNSTKKLLIDEVDTDVNTNGLYNATTAIYGAFDGDDQTNLYLGWVWNADFAWSFSDNSLNRHWEDKTNESSSDITTPTTAGAYDGIDQTNYYGAWTWGADFAWCFADEDSELDDFWHDQTCIDCDAELESAGEIVGIAIQNFTITNMECGNWVFAEEKYYYFQGTWSGETDIDTVKLWFNDTVHNIIVTYRYADNQWRLEEGDPYISMGVGNYTASGGDLVVTWPIMFKQSMLDSYDIDIYAWANSTSGAETGWEVAALDYFNLYVLGGRAEYYIPNTDNANRIVGGDVWDLNATDAGVAYANVTYRNLQHLHTKFNWAMDETYFDNNESAVDYVKFGCYICYEDIWINEWYGRIDLVDGHINDHDYWGIVRVRWYQNDTYIKYDNVTTFYEGHNSNDDWMTFYVDLWFNKINASTTLGGRVTPYYFGITDDANPWLVWIEGKDWGPMHGNATYSDTGYHSTYFDDIIDLEGNIISSKEITLVKVWFGIETDTSNADFHQIKNFMPLNFMTTRGDMEGIDTPEFIYPIMPDVPRGGLMDSLWKAIKGFADVVIKAVTALGNKIWNAIGDRFPWFTDFFDAMVDMTVQLAQWVGQLAEWIIGLLSAVFDMLSFVSYPIEIVAGTWEMIFDTYNDLFGTSLTTLAIVMFITIFGITVFEAATIGDWVFLFTLIRMTWAVASTILYWAYIAINFVVNTVISIIRG